ncbi:MAG: M28 family peptidase [Anaerolineae bacterium]
MTELPVAHPLTYVRHLTEKIGPRGSATPEEAQAARYVEQVLRSFGLDAWTESFEAGRSVWLPYALALALALAGALIYYAFGWPGALPCSLLHALALWGMYAELNFTDNFLRRLLPRGKSQNVIARIPPAGPALQDVVLIGHLDSGRTPFLFRSVPLLLTFVILSILAFFNLASGVIIYLAGAILGWAVPGWLFWPGALLSAGGVLFCLEAELSPYSVGANDNASAVGVNLSLAERLSRSPLKNTRVWVLFSGSEEVGCYGMAAFLTKHRDELREAYFINLEGVGIGALHYASREGMLRPYPSHPALIALLQRVGERRPELKAEIFVVRAGYTETGVVVKNGLRGITILGISPPGVMAYWHQRGDTADKLEEETLSRAHELTWELLGCVSVLGQR